MLCFDDSWRFAIERLFIFATLYLLAGCSAGSTKKNEVEEMALRSLVDNYKLEFHAKDENGRVIDLRLEGERFDDKALAIAGRFELLEGLSLAGSSVTDAGLESLPPLKNLQRMTIVGTRISDRGLIALGKMPALQNVWLHETPKMTISGVNRLKTRNPGVKIHVLNRPPKSGN
jgi:hypothetical protein